MALTHLSLVANQAAVAPDFRSQSDARYSRLDQYLMDEALVSPGDLAQAHALAARQDTAAEMILVAQGRISPRTLADAQAKVAGIERTDLSEVQGDPRLLDVLGAARALRMTALPLRRIGQLVLVAVPNPETFEKHRATLTIVFGDVAPTIATEAELIATITHLRPRVLAQDAETRVAVENSCRTMSASWIWLAVFLSGLAGLAYSAPLLTLSGLTAIAVGALFAVGALKLVAILIAIAGLRKTGTRTVAPPAPTFVRRPVVSLLVPLYRETQIASHLVARLSALDYPSELLDVLLIVEEDDLTTQNTLAGLTLPVWMRRITVPRGTIKTKPRALNYALNVARGSIVGVYDAEDAPEPAQITKIVDRFAQSASDVACLQGRLDYYNSTQNWLARCFTLEYASWFRVLLPGLEALRMPVPLGGTTLFFRRDILEALGGWDAHNVTEDADLGLRLARRGYRTELVDTVTQEEPNCRPWAWVRQRSRWLKGYAMTYAVHMRDPIALIGDVGLRGFLGIQVIFAGTLIGAILAPVLWTFWLVLLGVSHPLEPIWGTNALRVIGFSFLALEVLSAVLVALAACLTRHRNLLGWVPTLMLYFPLATIAVYKALIEIAYKPFFWDKTEHGVFDGPIVEAARPFSDISAHQRGLRPVANSQP